MSIERDAQGDSCVISTSFGNTAVQVTRWTGERVAITTTPTSQVIELGVNATMCEVTCTQDCFMRFGGAAVVADKTVAVDGSRFFLAGLQVFPTPIDPATGVEYTHLAFITDKIPAFVQVEQVI